MKKLKILPVIKKEDVKIDYDFINNPIEHIDHPAYWENEESYYGLSATVPADTIPWYATLLTGAMNIYQQKKYIAANAQRLQSGLPPVDAQTYAHEQIPSARAVVGLDRGTTNLVMYGGIALAGILLLSFMKKGR